MVKIFNKPDYIKPEINEPIYYLHLVILSVVVLGLLQYFTNIDILTIKNVLLSIPLLTLGDLLAHTILQLN